MMTSTHAVVGALVGALVGVLVPDVSTAAVLVGFCCGAAPDVDLLATHRRTCHFPVLAPLLAVPVAGTAVLAPTPATVFLAVGALAVAVHSVMDAFAGGVEHRPWNATSERAVYDHVSGRWIRPRRWVRWSGAPEDFLLSLAAGLPALALATGAVRALLGVVLVASGVFVLLRRRLAGLSERLFDVAT